MFLFTKHELSIKNMLHANENIYYNMHSTETTQFPGKIKG